jgi:reactive intermediate/imine deaminase
MKVLQPSDIVKPTASYSHGVAVGSFVFVAGQASLDIEGRVVGAGDIEAQTRQTIANLTAVLAEDGLQLRDVVSTTVYLSKLEDYRAYDRVYAECFEGHRPARATVRADLVMPELLVEIQAIAAKAERDGG